MLPRLHRVVTFYRRDNAIAVRSVHAMRDVARELKIELLERPVTSSDDLRSSLRALKPGAADAYLQAGDATIVSQTDMILDVARAKKLPTMFSDETSVIRGGLACYGLNYARPAGARPPTCGASCSGRTPASCRWSRWTTRTPSSTSRPPETSG